MIVCRGRTSGSGPVIVGNVVGRPGVTRAQKKQDKSGLACSAEMGDQSGALRLRVENVEIVWQMNFQIIIMIMLSIVVKIWHRELEEHWRELTVSCGPSSDRDR